VYEQAGSSLLVTLVLITLMTAMISAVIVLYLAQYRFIRRDAHRLQARYAAEAGVYVALDSLRRNPYWRPVDTGFDLPEGQMSRVTVEAFGGYLYIRSTAPYRRSRGTVRALVGEIPPAAFHNAIYLWDTESSLHVAGTTRITGDIVVGRRGVQQSTFKRRRFTGRIDGQVHQVPDLKPPFFDALERYLVGSPGSSPPPEERLPLAKRLPGENRVYLAAGSLRLTEADSLLLRDPLTVVARGDLTLEGPLRFQPGTIFITAQRLTIGGAVTGYEGLFFGRESIEMSGAVYLSGQFFSRKDIRITDEAYLRYPSVLYVTGEAAETGGGIFVEDGAVVDGTIVHPPLDPPPAIPRGRIVVEPAAQVRGAVFNAHETEFHGACYGALLTHQLYFYESPTSYVNWLKDAVVEVDERPIPYVLPLRFSLTPRLAVVNWEVHVEEPDLPL
jgi:hypothetical protein